MLKNRFRTFLWKILGIGYKHMVNLTDSIFLKEDTFTTMGVGSYDNNACVYRWSDSQLIIGKYCSISYGVKFIVDDGGHTYNKISAYPFKTNKVNRKRSGIEIGNDVWIGMNSVILYGVKIGDGATIAAGSIVTKDVAPYTVVGGVPAKLIKEKCSCTEASKMQKIAWWNWNKETIETRISDFKLDFCDFIAKYEKQ